MKLSTIHKLLPNFKEKFFHGTVTKWGRQWRACNEHKEPFGDVSFQDYRKTPKILTDQCLIDHFLAKPHFSEAWEQEDNGKWRKIPAIFGSYGAALRYTGDKVKVICIDADQDKFVDLLEEKVEPWLLANNINFIREYSGSIDKPRAHEWIFVDTDIIHTKLFLEQIQYDCQVTKEDWFDELYPYGSRENALIRLPFGLHLKKMNTFWGAINNKEEFNDIESALLAVESLSVLSEDNLMKLITPREGEKPKKVYSTPDKVIIKGDTLQPPIDDLPDFLNKVCKRCPAMNKILAAIKDEKLIDLRGQRYHDTGLFLSSWCQYNDYVNDCRDGEEFFDTAIHEFRSRSAAKHKWKSNWGRQKNISRILPSCKKLEQVYDLCSGCPYQGRISNPKSLYTAESLVKKKIKQVKIGSMQEIRDITFPEFDQDILNDISGDYVLDTVQNSGKSYHADELAVKLARSGKTVAISCHSAEVALEHQERIRSMGEEAFILFSFEKVFEHKSNDITCPNYESIKDCISLGLDSSYFKKKYCKSCPFYEECNYPKQYQELHEPEHKIVILQHAHFSCMEVVRQIFKKGFDTLIIDEYFLDFLITHVKPTPEEIEILQEFNSLDWVSSLLDWFEEGGLSDGKLKPKQEDLKPILNRHLQKGIDFKLDKFIRLFNEVSRYEHNKGIMKFTPIPEVFQRIILDATVDMEELAIILNNKNLKVVKERILIDPHIYHERNRNYKLLNSRTSKAQLLGKEKLYEWLELIGDQMSNEYLDLTALITVFKEVEEEVFEWLLRNYPHIISRIAVNHMAVGTNSFAKFNVQYILAGVYSHMIYKNLLEESYKLKFIYNYWARLEDRTLVNNPYPAFIDENASIKWHTEPVKAVHRDGFVYEYSQFDILTPDPESFEYLVYRRFRSKKQQTARIRYMPGKVSIKWFFDNDFTPDEVIDEVFLEEELLAKYREIED